MFATVILNTRQAGIGNGLTYAAPDGTNVHIGNLVRAPLRNKYIDGIVIDISEEKPEGNFDVKKMTAPLSDEPLLTKNQIAISKMMAQYYCCSLRYTIGVWLPGGDWQKLLPQKKEYIRLTPDVDTDTIRGPKQKALIEYLTNKNWVTMEIVREETGIGRDVVKRLIEKKMIEPSLARACAERSRSARDDTMKTAQHLILQSPPTLTPSQQAAFQALIIDKRSSLLFGVTGSGKTEIYASLIHKTIMDGKSAILLLPEILLTENFIGRFQQLVSRDAIAIVHSRITPAQKRDMWRQCRSGNIRLVIGSRSALFSPLKDLGCIIIDEEHEWTYKNEQSPRYHAVKVAEWMTSLDSAALFSSKRNHSEAEVERIERQRDIAQDKPKLLLGSATPSVESWHKAQNGDYQLIELPERYGGAKLPNVKVVDLEQVVFDTHYPLSPTLLTAIKDRLNKDEQSILFLNRRGFATSLLCMQCKERFCDSETHLPLTVHHQGSRPYLLSHHTGEKLAIPDTCPHCGGAELREVGAGTQRVEAILNQFFPTARIARADADTLKSPEQIRLLLKKMNEGQIDILLGTQSVVKGLDLPGVTLAAVILADTGLSLPHFRAGERVFQLLTQLTGRSGRKIDGEVIIQTFRPKAIEIELAAQHKVREYLEHELEERKSCHFPPDCEMVRIQFSDDDAEKKSKEIADQINTMSSRVVRPVTDVSRDHIKISRAPSLFNPRIWNIFVRGKNAQEVIRSLQNHNGIIDVDPVSCL